MLLIYRWPQTRVFSLVNNYNGAVTTAVLRFFMSSLSTYFSPSGVAATKIQKQTVLAINLLFLLVFEFLATKAP